MKVSASQGVSSTSPEVFLFKIQRHYQILQEKGQAVIDTSHVFAYSVEISVERYKSMKTLLQEVGETVEGVCSLLSETGSLPSSLLPYRYLPLVILQSIHEQVLTILPLMAGICQPHKGSAAQKERLRKEMSKKLKILGQDLPEGLKHMQALADQTLLEGRRTSQRSFTE